MNAVIESISLASRLTPINIEQDEHLREAILNADVELMIQKINEDFSQENLVIAQAFFDKPHPKGAELELKMIENSEQRQQKVFELSEYIYGDMFDVLDQLDNEFGDSEDFYLAGYQQKLTEELLTLWHNNNLSVAENLDELASIVTGYQTDLAKFIQGMSARDQVVQAFAHQGIFEVARHIDQDLEWYCPCEVVELYSEHGAIIVHQERGFSRNISISAEFRSCNFDVTLKFGKHHALYRNAGELAALFKQNN